jgi:hypothetical protein
MSLVLTQLKQSSKNVRIVLESVMSIPVLYNFTSRSVVHVWSNACFASKKHVYNFELLPRHSVHFQINFLIVCVCVCVCLCVSKWVNLSKQYSKQSIIYKADHDQPAHQCCLVMAGIVFCSLLGQFLFRKCCYKRMYGFVKNERWTKSFKIFNEIRVYINLVENICDLTYTRYQFKFIYSSYSKMLKQKV